MGDIFRNTEFVDWLGEQRPFYGNFVAATNNAPPSPTPTPSVTVTPTFTPTPSKTPQPSPVAGTTGRIQILHNDGNTTITGTTFSVNYNSVILTGSTGTTRNEVRICAPFAFPQEGEVYSLELVNSPYPNISYNQLIWDVGTYLGFIVGSYRWNATLTQYLNGTQVSQTQTTILYDPTPSIDNGCELEVIFAGSGAAFFISGNTTPTPTITSTQTRTPTPTATITPTPSRPAASMQFIGESGNTSAQSTYTFNGIDVGATGLLVIAIHSEASNPSTTGLSAVTINGNAATLAVSGVSAGGPALVQTAIYYAQNTEDSANISYTFNANQSRSGLGVWLLSNNRSDTPISTATAGTGTSGTGLTINVTGTTSNNLMVFAQTNGTQNTFMGWTNAQERYDTALGSNTQISGADDVNNSTSLTVSTQYTTSTQPQRLVGAVWN